MDIDKKNKLILIITVISILLAINIHQIKKHFIYQTIAREAFADAGVPVDQYMDGINFSKPVRMYKVKKGDVFIQYQVPNAPQGNFYGLKGSTQTELGINDMGIDSKTQLRVKKEKRIYMSVKDFNVLSSYAAPVIDNWSTPEDEARTEGKKLQFFTTCKPCFMRR
jgi:hypothetical protein